MGTKDLLQGLKGVCSLLRRYYLCEKGEVAGETFSDQFITNLYQQHKLTNDKLHWKKSEFCYFQPLVKINVSDICLTF